MSFGYFSGDVDCLTCVVVGAKMSLRICNLLLNLNKIPGSITEAQKLKSKLHKSLTTLLIIFTIVLISYIYTAINRINIEFTDGFFCTILGNNLISTRFIIKNKLF